MSPNRQFPTWVVLTILLIWNMGLTISITEILDTLANNQPQNIRVNNSIVMGLTRALEIVNSSNLKGEYLTFVIQMVFNHQNFMMTEIELRSLIQVLEELQNRSSDVDLIADFISKYSGPGGGSGSGSSGLSLPQFRK